MKRIVAAFVLLSVLAISIEAQDLNGFANDFEALMVGVTRDAAPNLQISALSGNIIGDADLDRFTFFFPSVGITVTDGIAPILETGAYPWEFMLEMPAIINTAVGDDAEMKENIKALESRFFPLMSMKMGFGIPLPSDMDLIVTGMYIPPAVTEALLKQAGEDIASQGIGFSTLNFGVEVRKTLLKDGKGIPALSLGGLYNFGAFNLEVSDLSLAKLTDGGVDVSGQTLDLNGLMEYKTSIHNRFRPACIQTPCILYALRKTVRCLSIRQGKHRYGYARNPQYKYGYCNQRNQNQDKSGCRHIQFFYFGNPRLRAETPRLRTQHQRNDRSCPFQS